MSASATPVATATTRAASSRRFYDVLGVTHDASGTEIRKGYRKAAIRFHPDKFSTSQNLRDYKGDEVTDGAQYFKLVSRAYEVLSDEEKRRRYDETGDEEEEEHVDPNDIFSHWWQPSSTNPTRRHEGNITQTLPVPLEAYYNGRTASVAITRDRRCDVCQGSGSSTRIGTVSCGECQGRGKKLSTRTFGPGMVQQLQVCCESCKGSGVQRPTSREDWCPVCSGQGFRRVEDTVEAVILPGAKDGEELVYRDMGRWTSRDEKGVPGDLILKTQQMAHETFVRRGDHLLTEATISLVEALTGFTVPLTTLDGRRLLLSLPPHAVLDPKFTYTVRGEGMPIPPRSGGNKETEGACDNARGNLYVRFRVLFPQRLADDGERSALRKLLEGCPVAKMREASAAEVILAPDSPKRGKGGAPTNDNNDDVDQQEDHAAAPVATVVLKRSATTFEEACRLSKEKREAAKKSKKKEEGEKHMHDAFRASGLGGDAATSDPSHDNGGDAAPPNCKNQ